MKGRTETEFIQFTWDSSVRGTKERERGSETRKAEAAGADYGSSLRAPRALHSVSVSSVSDPRSGNTREDKRVCRYADKCLSDTTYNAY